MAFILKVSNAASKHTFCLASIASLHAELYISIVCFSSSLSRLISASTSFWFHEKNYKSLCHDLVPYWEVKHLMWKCLINCSNLMSTLAQKKHDVIKELTPAELKLSMDIAEESSMDSAKSMDGNSMLIAKSISSEKELRVTEGLGGAIKSM